MRGVSSLLASGIACASLLHGAFAFVVTGVPTGGVQPRYEIRDLQDNHPVMWNLFLQSLESMQAEKQDDIASYYQISGIHGAPFTPWDGVQAAPSNGNWPGYCPHQFNLFGPWHRPYLALFEQRIAFWAQRIAAQFPAGQRRDMYTAAANKLRLPYWDWALDEEFVMPFAFRWPKQEVTRPGGKVENIDNPLLLYRFHPLDSAALNNSPWHQTMRGITNGKSDNGVVEDTLRRDQATRRQSVYNFLTRTGQKYEDMSNEGNPTQDNIEGIHDGIHTSFGEGSHMYDPVLSAFDPAFWLHHSNVDRMLAMWQYLYPETYVASASGAGGGTYTIPLGTVTDGNTDLTPFHSDESGNFWTSNAARDNEVFGYTYPELQGNPSKAKLKATINKLYGSVAGVSQAVERKLKFAGDMNMTATTIPGHETVYQYSAGVSMPKTMNGKSYSTCVYIGDGTEQPYTRGKYEKPVGCHSSFGMGSGISSGSIYLTEAIIEKYKQGDCKSLDKETVTKYLSDKLYWRAEQGGQSVYPHVQVHLSCTTVTPPSNPYDFPTYVDKHPITPINGTVRGL